MPAPRSSSNTSVPRALHRHQATPHGTRASNTTRQSATTQTHHNSQTAPTCIPARRTHPGARGVGGDLGRRGILRDDLARRGDRPRLQAAARAAGACLLGTTGAGSHPPRNYAGRDPRIMSPAWLLDILAALMLVVAAVSATRLATARLPANRLSAAEPTGSRSSPRGSGGADTDIAHLLMCIAGPWYIERCSRSLTPATASRPM